ncbi:Phytoene synthase (PSY) [Alteracholeplasma palmae J233]|uniref:Phytoene synthase (PSY) n=1 Tax=Alteracholeplasma palmae (strain ATCC 49389 / J233) TaxID=1318466 RepID=U4KQI3_ALTPJ|nr:phytoene/squalene synthase family protein [Alteracholeplasma palmae]CCV64630.1 Phytoene synthase (PSY) [Alteracholeplasma palmae J233]
MIQIKNDYLKCQEVIKKHSKTFYKAFSQLQDENKRNAVYGVYAFCRYADDLADKMQSKTQLDQLKSELDAFVKDGKMTNYIFRALKDVSEKYYPKTFDYAPFYDMILGQYMDLEETKYETMEDLFVYCQKVASSVGEMLVYILEPKGDMKKLKQVAYDLGIAMQLTNILRDIGEDFLNNRVYLPETLMKKHGLTHEMLANKTINEQFKNTFDELASIAYAYYDKAYQNFDAFNDESRLILTYALVIYREIIAVCKKEKYDVFSQKCYVSNPRKIALIKEVNAHE